MGVNACGSDVDDVDEVFDTAIAAATAACFYKDLFSEKILEKFFLEEKDEILTAAAALKKIRNQH